MTCLYTSTTFTTIFKIWIKIYPIESVTKTTYTTLVESMKPLGVQELSFFQLLADNLYLQNLTLLISTCAVIIIRSLRSAEVIICSLGSNILGQPLASHSSFLGL